MIAQHQTLRNLLGRRKGHLRPTTTHTPDIETNIARRCCRWNSESNIWRQAPFLIERVPTVLRLDPARENGQDTDENALKEGRVRRALRSDRVWMAVLGLELTIVLSGGGADCGGGPAGGG